MSGESSLGGSPRGTLRRRVKQLTNKTMGKGASPKTLGEIGHTVAEADKKVSLTRSTKVWPERFDPLPNQMVGSEGVEELRLELRTELLATLLREIRQSLFGEWLWSRANLRIA